jgi:hypothetical protein|tara:strand:- start:5109 stop:5270 length:162 start_codon:yes stop_codon:yes gene_type:complete
MQTFYKNSSMQIQISDNKEHIMLHLYNPGSMLKVEKYTPSRWKELVKIVEETA